MQTTTTAATLHVSLNVSDLGRSIDFYRELFGVEPAKVRPDYAKFELADPPLVLGLNPGGAVRGTPSGERAHLSHLGIRVSSAEALDEVRRRLEAGPLRVLDEGRTVCCYAEQEKLWVADPDGNAWELYELLGDSEERHPDPTGCCV